MLRRLKEQGITILVSTPYMDEATLCDRIALMQEGKVLAVDIQPEMLAMIEERKQAEGVDNIEGVLGAVKELVAGASRR